MDGSRLNKLPEELRNRIYRLALVQNHDIELILADSTRFSSLKNNTLALLSTCRQIRGEAGPIFFAENVFDVHADLLSKKELVFKSTRFMRMLMSGWLLSVGPHARHIKHIKFSIGSWFAYERSDDWVITAVPGILKETRALLGAVAAAPKLRLRVTWSNTGRFRNDFFVAPVVSITFSDVDTARGAIAGVLRDEDMLVQRSTPKHGEGSHSQGIHDAEDRRAELRATRANAERFIAKLESVLGP